MYIWESLQKKVQIFCLNREKPCTVVCQLVELLERQHLCMRSRWKQQDFLGFPATGKIRVCSDRNKLLGISDRIKNFHPGQKFLMGQSPPPCNFFLATPLALQNLMFHYRRNSALKRYIDRYFGNFLHFFRVTVFSGISLIVRL
jgi:hypothetical protein